MNQSRVLFLCIRLAIGAIVYCVCWPPAFAQSSPDQRAFDQRAFDHKDREEFSARRARLFEQIADGVAVILAGEEHIYPVKFHQSPDFYYLTGIEDPGAVLVLAGAKREAFVLAHKRSPDKITMEGPGLLEQPKPHETYGLTRALPMESLIPVLNYLTREAQKLYVQITPPDSLQYGRLEIDYSEANLFKHPLYRYTPFNKQAISRLRELYPHLTAADVSPLLDRLRWIKTPYEIERLRRSGQIGAEALKEGIVQLLPFGHHAHLASLRPLHA